MIGPAVGSPTVAAAVRGQRTVAAAPGEPRAYITAAPSDPRARCMELPPPPPHRTRTDRPTSCAPPPVCRGVGRVVPRSADRAQSPPPPLPQNSSSSEPHYGEQFKANGPRSHVVIAAAVLSLSVVVACHMRREKNKHIETTRQLFAIITCSAPLDCVRRAVVFINHTITQSVVYETSTIYRRTETAPHGAVVTPPWSAADVAAVKSLPCHRSLPPPIRLGPLVVLATTAAAVPTEHLTDDCKLYGSIPNLLLSVKRLLDNFRTLLDFIFDVRPLSFIALLSSWQQHKMWPSHLYYAAISASYLQKRVPSEAER
ncbi:hypothetical protein QTP88_011137 [Uroleucon formosanum]